MTAFLFIPASVDGRATLANGRAALANGRTARRVDFGNIASLFAEVEEPVFRPGKGRGILRVGATLLLLALAVGDTLLVARPAALAGCPLVTQTTRPTL